MSYDQRQQVSTNLDALLWKRSGLTDLSMSKFLSNVPNFTLQYKKKIVNKNISIYKGQTIIYYLADLEAVEAAILNTVYPADLYRIVDSSFGSSSYRWLLLASRPKQLVTLMWYSHVLVWLLFGHYIAKFQTAVCCLFKSIDQWKFWNALNRP